MEFGDLGWSLEGWEAFEEVLFMNSFEGES